MKNLVVALVIIVLAISCLNQKDRYTKANKLANATSDSLRLFIAEHEGLVLMLKGQVQVAQALERIAQKDKKVSDSVYVIMRHKCGVKCDHGK